MLPKKEIIYLICFRKVTNPIVQLLESWKSFADLNANAWNSSEVVNLLDCEILPQTQLKHKK